MRKVLMATTATFVVVAVSGVYQTFRYVPRGSQWVSDVHRWSSFGLVALVLVALAVWLTRRVELGRGGALALAIALVAALVGAFTGGAIHWDQLIRLTGPRGETVEGVRGVIDLAGAQFVVVDGHLLQPDSFHRTVLVHTVIVGVVMAAMLGVAWFLAARRGQNPGTAPTELEDSNE